MRDVTSFINGPYFRLMSEQEKLTEKRKSLEARFKTDNSEKSELDDELSNQTTKRRHFEDNLR